VTERASQPIPAATVVLVRPGDDGLEVLLTRRPASMAFAPVGYVFPGGRVDPDDRQPSLVARSVVTPDDAARAMGGDLPPGDAIATEIAAIRELFEEAGVLLADSGDGGDGSAGRRAVSSARSALVGGDATFVSIVAELGLRLGTDRLVPLSRWVTPPIMARRFDARFFAAELPEGARVSFEGDEVAGHAWLTPAAALRAMADGEIAMWVPTSATLQQLEHVRSFAEIRERLAPGRLGAVEVESISPEITRIVMPAGGGVAGQPVCAYLLGRTRHVLIDPGDPTGPGLERAIAIAAERGGSIAAIALTQVDPDHAGGAEGLALTLDVPIFAGPGAGRPLPYAVQPVGDGERLTVSDAPVVAIRAPGPRPDHVAFNVGAPDDSPFVVAGDLGGLRGARTVLPAADAAATAASIERLRTFAPAAAWLSGHPDPVGVDAGRAHPEAPSRG
jgi:glyoxylase-like metal-dependent hydrolase (beta-lactamase superfamily II)/8-oxo-dGTP pyrophosphatase MutT (NUDIX family)